MVVENHGQQQSVRFVVDTEKCCGCKRCIRRCMENVWQWDKEKEYAYPKYPDECVLCLQCEMDCLNITGRSIGIQRSKSIEKEWKGGILG